MATFTSSGRDYVILTFALTDSFSNISVTRAAMAFTIQVKGGSTVKWRRSATDTGEWTIKPDISYSVDSSLGTQDGATKIIGQAKVEATGGADTLELWLWYG